MEGWEVVSILYSEQLKQQRDKLKQYQKRIGIQLGKERELARQLLRGGKKEWVMSIEEVERIMDETQEAVEYQRQLDEILAGGITQEDEDAILAELDAITQEEIELPEVPAEPLPTVPAREKGKEPVNNTPKQEMVAAS
ncbi:hypothetical protein scyTo_0010678 [Scyliorhinus torazame]|uniref:Charged multivesicular body protein 6 n=1 Tax=Scyliorhinus torazame TaxID=75743 RepID=A0A401PA37_SCYTO|nr:hypothetical protein [Scyliorhinus torazame]